MSCNLFNTRAAVRQMLADVILSSMPRCCICLPQAIDAFSVRDRAVGKPLRLPISDVFKAKSGALMVGGKIEAGAVKVRWQCRA